MFIKRYLNLVKFSHSIFALPFAIIGFFLGIKDSPMRDNSDYYTLFLLIVLCMVFARNSAMAFNRLIDLKIDILNPRTKNRELPAKILNTKQVFIFIAINTVLFIITTFFINTLCFYLSPLALLIILGYSYTKRFTFFSHFFLGLALSISTTGAYLSITGSFSITPLLFSLAILFWVSGFDIIYALQDIEFDKTQRLKSIPAKYGFKKSQSIAFMIHLMSLIILFLIGHFTFPKNIFYNMGFVIFSALIFYQHYLIYAFALKKINTAFFILNGIASILFALFTCIELYFII